MRPPIYRLILISLRCLSTRCYVYASSLSLSHTQRFYRRTRSMLEPFSRTLMHTHAHSPSHYTRPPPRFILPHRRLVRLCVRNINVGIERGARVGEQRRCAGRRGVGWGVCLASVSTASLRKGTLLVFDKRAVKTPIDGGLTVILRKDKLKKKRKTKKQNKTQGKEIKKL